MDHVPLFQAPTLRMPGLCRGTSARVRSVVVRGRYVYTSLRQRGPHSPSTRSEWIVNHGQHRGVGDGEL